jgi:hypothetical protein
MGAPTAIWLRRIDTFGMSSKFSLIANDDKTSHSPRFLPRQRGQPQRSRNFELHFSC